MKTKHTTNAFRTYKPLRLRIPKLIDLVLVSDAEQIVARAYAATGDLDVAFLSDSWSACPARRVIPEMLRIAWRSAHHREAEVERLLSINNWSRLWHRAVS